ncbi:ribonuclease 2-like [Castanea sativa]|uniref:ribonuclease 2-like n=1 Tax=Castanea sativa TaxID=21020 RepID=UPI003F64AC9C
MACSLSVSVQFKTILLLVCLQLAVSVSDSVIEQREFDYFKLALHCSSNFCQCTCHCCSFDACCRHSNTPAEFYNIGLWPDYNDGSWPACCTKSNFEEKLISTLHETLEKYWPSLSCGSSSTGHGGKGSLLEHEDLILYAGYIQSNTENYPLGGIVSAIENAFHPLPVCSKGMEELHLCFYKDF